MKEIEEKSKDLAEKSEKSNKLMDDMKNNIEKLQEDITSKAKHAYDKVNFPYIKTLDVVLLYNHSFFRWVFHIPELHS